MTFRTVGGGHAAPTQDLGKAAPMLAGLVRTVDATGDGADRRIDRAVF